MFLIHRLLALSLAPSSFTPARRPPPADPTRPGCCLMNNSSSSIDVCLNRRMIRLERVRVPPLQTVPRANSIMWFGVFPLCPVGRTSLAGLMPSAVQSPTSLEITAICSDDRSAKPRTVGAPRTSRLQAACGPVPPACDRTAGPNVAVAHAEPSGQSQKSSPPCPFSSLAMISVQRERAGSTPTSATLLTVASRDESRLYMRSTQAVELKSTRWARGDPAETNSATAL